MPMPALRRRLALAVLPLLVLAAPGPAVSAAKSCASPRDWYLNPFMARSAHHRPIGTGARYAADSHPATRDWLKARTFAISGLRPGSLTVAASDALDPLGTVRPLSGCGPVSGLPVVIRLPRAGLPMPAVGLGPCPDQSVVIYDAITGTAHQFGQFRWNDGSAAARLHRAWDIRGLGHGIHPGRRLGLSASGVTGLFGLLRGHEIDTPGRPIEHALQMLLPHRTGCKVMLSAEVVLPAVARDPVKLPTATPATSTTARCSPCRVASTLPDCSSAKLGRGSRRRFETMVSTPSTAAVVPMGPAQRQ